MAGEPMNDKNDSAWVLLIAMVASATIGIFAVCGVVDFARMVWAAVAN